MKPTEDLDFDDRKGLSRVGREAMSHLSDLELMFPETQVADFFQHVFTSGRVQLEAVRGQLQRMLPL